MLAVRTVAPRCYDLYSCQPALLETAVQSARIVPGGLGGVGDRFARGKGSVATLLVSNSPLANSTFLVSKLAQISITRRLRLVLNCA